jgi:hypothetical protein
LRSFLKICALAKRNSSVCETLADCDDLRGMSHMRLLFSLVLMGPLSILYGGANVSIAQTSSAPSGGGGPAAAAPGRASSPASPAPATPTAPITPGQAAPGVANTPVDPGRNNTDVNPPTRRLEQTNPSVSGPVISPPSPGIAPGGQTSQPTGKAAGRPGVAQSANSDGYKECMAMWSPANTGMSREEWSKTCDQTRLPPK